MNGQRPPLPERIHTDWLKAFIGYASYGEAPMDMLYWTGVSTIAGALRRRVWLDMKYFCWLPNFYIVFVAPPGIVSKSTTINIGMELLRSVDGVKLGPDVVTWQSLLQALAGSTELVYWPLREQYLPMSCLTVASDELGNFLNPQDRDMVDVLVSLWDGKKGTFRKETKTSGSDLIENPWFNIIGCTTPSWIGENFPRYLIGGGLASRTIYLYADEKRQYVPYPDEVVPKNFEESRRTLLHDLEIISMLVGEFQLDPLARAWGREWYMNHWKNPPPDLQGEDFGGYLARKQTHIHKLAMVHSASQGNSLVIERMHLETAAAVMSAVEPNMPLVFAKVGQNDLTRAASELTSHVEKYGPLSVQQLYSKLFRSVSYKDFEVALVSAVNAGKLERYQHGNDIFLRRKR